MCSNDGRCHKLTVLRARREMQNSSIYSSKNNCLGSRWPVRQRSWCARLKTSRMRTWKVKSAWQVAFFCNRTRFRMGTSFYTILTMNQYLYFSHLYCFYTESTFTSVLLINISEKDKSDGKIMKYALIACCSFHQSHLLFCLTAFILKIKKLN